MDQTVYRVGQTHDRFQLLQKFCLFCLRTATGKEDALFPFSCIHWQEERKNKSAAGEGGLRVTAEFRPAQPLSQCPPGPVSWRLKAFLWLYFQNVGALEKCLWLLSRKIK